MTIFVSGLAILLASVIGFSAHRASLCSVRAVEEILTTRRAFMLASFIKTALWVVALSLIFAWIWPAETLLVQGWSLSVFTIVGAVLFGVGAAINGGCAFSTLTKLGAGNAGMILSLAGFFCGAAVFHGFLVAHFPGARAEGTGLPVIPMSWRLPAAALFGCWMVWELWKIIPSPTGISWRKRAFASRYRLSAAAALMGSANAVLYIFIGAWPYTRLISDTARQVTGSTPTAGQIPASEAFPLILWFLCAGLVTGICVSAWQSRRFRWQLRPKLSWINHMIGGFCMGFGAAMIPGGNDILIFNSIPSLSPHAVPAFLAMLLGIAGTLSVMRLLGKAIPPADCGGDLCKSDSE